MAMEAFELDLLNGSIGILDLELIALTVQHLSEAFRVGRVLVHEIILVALDILFQVFARLIKLQVLGYLAQTSLDGLVKLLAPGLQDNADIVDLQVKQSREGECHHDSEQPNSRLFHITA
jgi:hypothetical protein